MENFVDIFKITIPALIVLATAWFILSSLIKNEQEKRRQELILQNNHTILPIKLQAYERVVLFLERISLESMLVRVSTPNMTASQLHTALLTNIRNEFEHNLSQQIYMSPQAWEIVRNARSGMIKMINSEFEKLPKEATSIDLSKSLVEAVMKLEKEPTHAAIDYIKSEVAKII